MLTNKELEKVNSWCAMNDPANVLRVRGEEPVFFRSGFSGIPNPVVSGGAVTGDGLQDALDKDKAFQGFMPPAGENPTMDQYDNLLAIFRSNPGTGCTTVMDMARIAAGFNPLNPDLKDNEKAFDDYVGRIMSAPFFFLNDSSRTEYHRGEKSWNLAVNDIVNLYEGIEKNSKDQIRKSIINMTQAAASRKNTRQTKSLFAQSTLNLENEIQVYIYSSNISLIENKGRKSTSRQTDISIVKARLTFYKNLWPSYAQIVMNRHVKMIDAWVKDNTTQPGANLVDLTCFEPTA
ncbi:MAG: hypothetical protein F6K55_04190 [Moorea sp. SIO4A3]|nr:hypothetical protein [Moorena sp. SIO4A3]